ncbi:CD63 antigen-like [Mercenaria mercenaria]|uniref:CD63 antigen-like n=1 Tax=Mercenaria mercenaria TaxID=6596 RepID=UPI00234E84B6|nr:CD63 antigen-like [Mercenaria mercenaria]
MGIRDFGAVARFGQCFLIFVNIWFALLGIGMIVIGVLVRVNRGIADSRIIQMLRQGELGGLNLGDIIVALSAIIIVVGVFTLLMSADGGFGACFRKKGLLIVYVVILLLILIIEIAAFILWCKLYFGTNNWLKQQFDNLLRFYNGIQGATDVYSDGWNLMFILLDCCGSSPVSTFRNDFVALQTYWWSNPTRLQDQIPFSCCKEATLQNYRFSRNPLCTQAGQQQLYRPRGCYGAFRDLLNNISAGAIALSVLLIITEILAIIAAIMMIRAINKEKRGSLDTTNSNVYRKGTHEIALPDSKPR